MDGYLLLRSRYDYILMFINSKDRETNYSHNNFLGCACVCLKVALKLVPNNNTFINVLSAKDESHQMVENDISSLISLLIPLLSQLHSILVSIFFFF